MIGRGLVGLWVEGLIICLRLVGGRLLGVSIGLVEVWFEVGWGCYVFG